MLKIIVAEDEIGLHDIIKEMLMEHLGDSIIIKMFTNGEDALNEIAEKGADALFTDLEMPKMNGLLLSRNVRYGLKLSIPVVMCTGKPEMVSQIEADEYGIKGVYEKLMVEDAAEHLSGLLKEAVQ